MVNFDAIRCGSLRGGIFMHVCMDGWMKKEIGRETETEKAIRREIDGQRKRGGGGGGQREGDNSRSERENSARLAGCSTTTYNAPFLSMLCVCPFLREHVAWLHAGGGTPPTLSPLSSAHDRSSGSLSNAWSMLGRTCLSRRMTTDMCGDLRNRGNASKAIMRRATSASSATCRAATHYAESRRSVYARFQRVNETHRLFSLNACLPWKDLSSGTRYKCIHAIGVQVEAANRIG